jgi:hypothetical protein
MRISATIFFNPLTLPGCRRLMNKTFDAHAQHAFSDKSACSLAHALNDLQLMISMLKMFLVHVQHALKNHKKITGQNK